MIGDLVSLARLVRDVAKEVRDDVKARRLLSNTAKRGGMRDLVTRARARADRMADGG